MTGQMTKYRKSLGKMSEPIMPGEIQKKLDLRGILEYAKQKGVKVAQLTEMEKNLFVKDETKKHS